jgi:hypothetical protein
MKLYFLLSSPYVGNRLKYSLDYMYQADGL